MIQLVYPHISCRPGYEISENCAFESATRRVYVEVDSPAVIRKTSPLCSEVTRTPFGANFLIAGHPLRTCRDRKPAWNFND